MRSLLRSLAAVFAVLISSLAVAQGTAAKADQDARIHSLKITLLSTMLVGETTGIGEWGFSALIEADGRRVLVDTGLHPETVLQNARDLKIDLSDVQEVILTHNHGDHVGDCSRCGVSS